MASGHCHKDLQANDYFWMTKHVKLSSIAKQFLKTIRDCT